MKLFAAGVSHSTAGVAVREQMAISRAALRCQGCRLRAMGSLEEAVILSTCNRVEVYGTTMGSREDVLRVFGLLTASPCEWGEHLYFHEGAEAMRHLFKVTCGLDSMVLGETEITGQVKTAYESARSARSAGRILNQLFQSALRTAKEIRTQTGIGRGATSVGSAAAEVAERIFGAGLADSTVLILGAGQMGETCARHLVKKAPKALLVSNRSFERAQLLASEIGGEPIPFESCQAAIPRADIVVVSTACPHLVLTFQDVERVLPARRGRPLFLVDISVPRNVDPAVDRLNNVFLYNIDDLQAIAHQNVCQRQQALADCERIIDRSVAALLPRLARPNTSNADAPSRHPVGWLLRGSGAVAAA